MIHNRELAFDDYLAMFRRRWKALVVPALLAPLAGFFVSFAFTPKYTSQSQILVETQKVPEGYVQPVVTEDLSQRIVTMQQQVMSQTKLQALIDKLGLAKGRNVDEVMDEIRKNFSVESVESDISAARRHKPGQGDIPGFYLNYAADNPRLAQQVCTELTSMLLVENLETRTQTAQGTTEFLSRQLDQAKQALDDQDKKLAVFKKQYLGQLPGDEDNNLRLLAGLNTQLDAYTQALNRAQQDKAYTQSLLAQQVATWKASQASLNPETLQKQLADLQSQLITLEARYTDDHPDVAKTKSDIAEVKHKLDEMNASAPANASLNNQKESANEPPEIRQLRLQVHQYDEAIAQSTAEQKRLQDQINRYQGRIALSPGVEEQYKQLTRDYETAQKFYNDLLGKKSESEMQTDMERRQQGEQMSLLNPANLPDSPSFPNRLLFAGGGLGAGVAFGFILAFWMEMRDKALRTEQDVVAVLDLPVLVSVPWVGQQKPSREKSGKNGNGKRPIEFAPPVERKKEAVEA